MKLDKERQDLEITIAKYLYDINANIEKKRGLISFLTDKGYLVGSATSMTTGNVTLETLPEIDLYVLLVGMHNLTKIGELNPEHWLNKDEIKSALEYRELSERETLTFPIILDNVLEVVEGEQWIFVADMSFVDNLYSAKMVKYNFRTQRNPRLIKRRDGFKKVPNTNRKAIPQIAQKIRDKLYTPNTITFNISKEDVHDFVYEADKKRLTILEGTINILDGYHRCLAMMALMVTDPELEFKFELRFVNYDEPRAAAFVKQEDIRNKISEQHLASINMSEIPSSVTRQLNEGVESDMKGKIATDGAYIREGEALTMFITISETIDELWELVTRTDGINLGNYLTEFFNELIGLKQKELFTNIAKNKGKNYINHEGTFIFYLTIAKEIQKYENWKELLKDIMDITDFNKDNPFWNSLGVITTSEDAIKRHRKNAITRTKEYIDEVLEK